MSHQPTDGVAARPASPGAGTFAALWQSPETTVARMTLGSYLRSGWLWGEGVAVVGLFLVLWWYPGDQPYFFGAAALGLGALGFVGTAILTQRAFSARVYLPLARLTDRSAYLRGVVLASAVLRVAWQILLTVLCLADRKILNPTAGGMFAGELGLLALCVVFGALTMTLSPPVATRLHRIVFLAWLVAALSSFHYNGPLSSAFALTQLPLVPLAGCYGLGAGGLLDWHGVLALLGAALYVVVITWVGGWLLERRDLIRV
jgi:hypothetical protein